MDLFGEGGYLDVVASMRFVSIYSFLLWSCLINDSHHSSTAAAAVVVVVVVVALYFSFY